jgi:hypothetical protein
LERLDRRATVAEVKRNPERYKSKELEEKYEHIKAHLRGYKVELLGLSMDDM